MCTHRSSPAGDWTRVSTLTAPIDRAWHAGGPYVCLTDDAGRARVACSAGASTDMTRRRLVGERGRSPRRLGRRTDALQGLRVRTIFQNAVLTALAPEDASRLTDRGVLVDLKFGETLYESGDTVDHVYFPESGLISLLLTTLDGRAAEAGMVGFEGALALVEACGSGIVHPRAMVQVPGKAWRVRARDCQALSKESPGFCRAVWSRMEFQLVESRQAATCRSFHPVEARLARWLMECLDRGKADRQLAMTQEFIAAMLGVQRTTVSAFTPELQKGGLIRYGRGKIEVIDPHGLENLACECRTVIRQERKRLSGT